MVFYLLCIIGFFNLSLLFLVVYTSLSIIFSIHKCPTHEFLFFFFTSLNLLMILTAKSFSHIGLLNPWIFISFPTFRSGLPTLCRIEVFIHTTLWLIPPFLFYFFIHEFLAHELYFWIRPCLSLNSYYHSLAVLSISLLLIFIFLLFNLLIQFIHMF